MRNKISIFIVVIQLMIEITCHIAPSLAKSPPTGTANLQSQNNSQLATFPELELAIPQPIGFEKATSFYGFQQSSTSSSVLLMVIPGPFREVIKGLNRKDLAARGIKLLSKQSIKIKNQPGFLLEIAQDYAGLKFRKWIVVFGNDQKTHMVTATFLKKDVAKLSTPLKKVVLAVSPISKPTSASFSSLPFSVTVVDGLMLVQKMSGVGPIAVFSKNGQLTVSASTDPLFLVAPSLGAVSVSDRQAFAIRRLSGYPKTGITAVKSTQEIVIDNLPGWEIIAEAQDQPTKAPLKLYQVMLFPKQGGYVLMTGIVGSQQSSLYMPKFKAMAWSYKNSGRLK